MTKSTITIEPITHELKIYPEFFSAVCTGVKRAELRKNDRDYRVGDTLHLMETPRGSCHQTGEFINVKITHIADVGEWIPGYVLLSVELQERRKVERDTEPYGFTDGDRRGMIYEPQYADRLKEPLPVYRHAQQPVLLNGFSVDRMEVLADRLSTRITSLEIHERAGNISSTQQETLDAFRIALEVLMVKQTQPAAPKLPGSEPATLPGKWIPVSERMPEVGDIVLAAMGGAVIVSETECTATGLRFFTAVISGRELPATHWMPLTSPPQDVKK